jgi:hypothetical protein
MIYVKSFLAGLAALIALSTLIVGAAFLAPVVMERLPLQAGNGDGAAPQTRCGRVNAPPIHARVRYEVRALRSESCSLLGD